MLLTACAGYAYADDSGEISSGGGDIPDETGGADIGPTTDGFFSYDEFNDYYDKWKDRGDFLGDFFDFVTGLVGGGGDDSGEISSGGGDIPDETGGEVTDNSPVDLMGLHLVGGPVESGAKEQNSIKNYKRNENSAYYVRDSDKPNEWYYHSWATISTYDKVTDIRLRTRKKYRTALNQWLAQGYDVLVTYRLYGGERTGFNAVMVEHGKWGYDEQEGKYKTTQQANVVFYDVPLSQTSRLSFYDGRNVFTFTDVNPLNKASQQVDVGYALGVDVVTDKNSATYVGVIYADGTTGTGGAPTGDGGGTGSGDTYNNNYDYSTNTTYNNLDLDLSPITQRQDALFASVNQIGRDVNALLQSIDDDLFKIYMLVAALLRGQRSMQSVLVEIRDAIANLQLDGGSVDVDFSELYDELEDFHIDFNSFWEELMQKLETIIRDIENMRRWEPREPLPSPPVGETGIVPWEDVLNITALRDALTRLMSKFPFATINNLITIITALTRPPVAPVFDLPMPNPSDWSQPYMVHVDLSPFDTVAATMRIGITLWAIARVSRRTVSMWTREEGGGDA